MFVVLLAYLAFFSIAMPASMFGVIWPSMGGTFGLPLSAAGVIPPVGVAAGLISATLSPRLIRRFGLGRVVALGALVSVIALTGEAFSVAWWQILACVAVSELGAGAVDTSLNVHASRAFGARQVSWMHASYGIGAAVAPLIATATLAAGHSWRWALGVVALLLFVVAIVLLANVRRWGEAGNHASIPSESASPGPDEEPRQGADERAGRHRTSGFWNSRMALGLVLVGVQTGLESTVSIWGFTFMTHHLHISVEIAGMIASGYWWALMLARIGFGSLAERIGPWRVLRISGGVLVGAVVLVNLPVPAVGVAAVALFGVACAPVYPLLVLTTSQRATPGTADQVVGFQSAASSVGAATLPGLVGLAVGHDAGWFAPGVALLSVVTLCLLWICGRRVPASADRIPKRFVDGDAEPK